MKIAIGSDHAGFKIKEFLKGRLVARGIDAVDCGPSSDARSDYPDFAKKVARLVQDGSCERGVLICGSGIGMCMAANRFNGVRAAVLQNEYDARMSRRHNDANVACFGARTNGDSEKIAKLLDLFLDSPFDGGRHEGRAAKIDL